MNTKNILNQLEQKDDINKLAAQLRANPDQIEILVNTIKTEKSAVKFGCEKLLRLVSETNPELIYPYFDFYVRLLDIDNKFLKWGAIITLSNLAAADTKNKFKKIFDKYYAPVKGPEMVAAANLIGNSWKIALAKPELTGKITAEILKVSRARYKHKGELSPECKNIVIGAAIESFEKFFGQIKNKKKIISFVKKQMTNPRPQVKRKAEKFLKKFNT